VATPSGVHAATVDDAVAAANQIGYPCVVKAQVAIGKRGKAGAIQFAANDGEARTHATALLGRSVYGGVRAKF